MTKELYSDSLKNIHTDEKKSKSHLSGGEQLTSYF